MNIPQASLLVLLAMIPFEALGLACSSSDITLSTQVDVDGFQATYGDGGKCDRMLGNLTVTGSDISDLDGLFSITSVGALSILSNGVLNNKDGLANLESVGRGLEFDITHPRPRHLIVKLTSPAGTTTTLWNQGTEFETDLVGTFPATLTPVDDLSSLVTDEPAFIRYSNTVFVIPLEPPLFRDGFESDVTVPGPVAITSFSATPNVIIVGESTTLSWSTENATSCTPSGGTADWRSLDPLAASGNANIVIDSAGTYSFDLTCQNADDQVADSTTVTVSPEGPLCDPPLAGNVVGWNTFWGTSFPGPVYENIRNWVIPQKGYLAIEFDSGNVIDTGTIASLENSASPGIRIGSISQCPGDFNTSADCSYSWGLGGGIRWTTQGVSGACDLDANATYYFNITFTDGVDPNSTNCNATPCRINLQHSNF